MGCTESHWQVLPYPIPMQLSGPAGGLIARASVDGSSGPFDVMVDTGTILTVYDDGTPAARARLGDLTMFGIGSAGESIPRLSITHTQLFQGPLGSLGVGADVTPVGGVIGGDNLSRFSVGLDYRAAAPTMTLSSNVTPCNCELAPACARQDSCNAVLPFKLAGGQDTNIQSQTRIVLGNDQYSYPSTRVLVDACLEPLPDPIETQACVAPGFDCPSNPSYLPSGSDMKLLVSTGFPGMALSANAYDRLRGAGAAAALFAAGTTPLHLVDPADEGAGVQAGKATLGRAAAAGALGASSLALVSGNEFFFGPCALLSRSRRIRRVYLATTQPERDAYNGGNHQSCAGELCCYINADRKCSVAGGAPQQEPYAGACVHTRADDKCNDDSINTPVPAVVEMKAPLEVWVLPDLTPLIVGINSDVRPTAASVDGIIGTELLQHLVTTVDYPSSRLIVRCAREDDCAAYPRLSIPSLVDCGFCAGPRDFDTCGNAIGMHACPPAP
ncbi:MAG: hypothetical protein JWN44_5307 [Myxococcales bacterium]|nr:hypothetical protein [Myxococcales bacterium]